jgi:hypothetical protein
MKGKHFSRIAIYALGFSAVLSVGFVSKASVFNEPDLLAVQIRATDVKAESIDQILGRLTDDYAVPVGIELGDPQLTPSREIHLRLPETTLKDFLDAVIAKDPRYTWKLERGVIHVRPLRGRDTLLATLLDTKVSHFAIIGATSRYRIYNDLMNLPEIRSQLVIAGVDPMIFLSSGTMRKLGKDTVFDESSLTLSELLDKIILRTEIRRWVITRWGKNGEYITLRS